MATVRQFRRTILVVLWFLFSVVRAWPSRLTAFRSAVSFPSNEAIVLHLPSGMRPVRYGLQLSVRPATLRLLRIAVNPVPTPQSPGAFVSRMQSKGTTPAITRTTTHTTLCTAPPPPPPPTSTSAGSTKNPPPACSRTTVNTVCVRVADTSGCRRDACCWMNGADAGCTLLSSYTIRYPTTYTTYTGCFLRGSCVG